MKSPKDSAIHLGRFLTGIPDEIRPQIQGFLWVCERDWCDFVSYDPRQKDQFRLLIIRAHRDEPMIKLIEQSVLEAESEAQALISRLERIAA